MIDPSRADQAAPAPARATPARATAVPSGATRIIRSCGDRPMFERPREDRLVRARGACLEAGRFQDLGLADGVGEDRPGRRGGRAPCSGPAVAAAGRRAGRRALASRRSSKRPVSGFAQPGPSGLANVDLADDPRMDLVPAVEVDAVPVDEPLAGPGRREAHRVVVEDHPGRPRDTPPGPGSSRTAIPL